MKKLILFLLIGALLVLPLSGCFADNQQNEGTTPNNTTENTTPEATTPENTEPDYNPGPDETTPEVTTPDNPPEVTTPPANDQNNPPMVEGELDKNSELIVELIAYLEQYLVEYDLISVSFSSKVNGIKNGAQPLHVAFDPNNYYFVGGYYNTEHKDSVIDYRYASEYVWVGYESEAEIQEYYNDMPCVVIFQINRALTVTNILSDEPANDMEHFQIYKATFENGVNTAPPITFGDTFIYLNNFSNRFDEDTIYHSKSWYYHENATIPCICLDGEYYLPFYLATLEDGEIFDAQQALSTNQITYTLGEYYDAIISVMDIEKYSVEVNEKYTYRYGVVSIDDFVNLITPDNPPEVTTPPEGNQNHPPVVEGEVDKNSDLIVELVTYWKELSMDILIYPLSFSQKIHTIEQGKQPLHVAFDPDDYYFVCAYNSPDNENFSYDDCIWVRYEKETAIQETYNGGKLAKAFQINRSLSVTDILPSDKPVPDMEHFRPYDPVFENGINTAAPLFFNESFIYLNDSTDETIYYSMRQSTDSILVIPCVYFENQYYLSFRHYVIDSDGKQGEKGSYEGMFGDYCDVLSDKAVAEKYSVTNDGGFTWFYVLVPLEDFVNGVLK